MEMHCKNERDAIIDKQRAITETVPQFWSHTGEKRGARPPCSYYAGRPQAVHPSVTSRIGFSPGNFASNMLITLV